LGNEEANKTGINASTEEVERLNKEIKEIAIKNN